MSLTISIRFWARRAHLHPWQTHHSEGRVEWPPSPWRLLRALVAVAGRRLTTLPHPDFIVDPGRKPRAARGKSPRAWPPAHYDSLPDNWHGDLDDEIPVSRLAGLVRALSSTPTVWLPRTGIGHTRQYVPIHRKGIVRLAGSSVFDTFAAVRRDQPLLFHWSDLHLDEPQVRDLKVVLGQMTYFGRAESWCAAEAHRCRPPEIVADGIGRVVPGQTHWECVCIEEGGHPTPGKEYRDYLLERRLAPAQGLKPEVVELLPGTKTPDGNRRKGDPERFRSVLALETEETLLLRCLLRESSQDMRDGLEHPIGTRWVHYAVPRAIYDVPCPEPRQRPRTTESVDLVRYALHPATAHRPTRVAVTDTLLLADKFRSAALAVYGERSGQRGPRGAKDGPDDQLFPRALCGHERDGRPCQGHDHAFWWPLDEDNDGFIDHVMVRAPGGFESREIDALRQLTWLRQPGGRPDLLVTPVLVGQERNYHLGQAGGAAVFVSATPYFCPVHLSHGRKSAGRTRSLQREVVKSLLIQGLIETEDEISAVNRIVFGFAPAEPVGATYAVAGQAATEPMAPHPSSSVMPVARGYPPVAQPLAVTDIRYRDAILTDADESWGVAAVQGLRVDHGHRFVRALSFCRRRQGHQLQGNGLMLQITFSRPRPPRPFAIGSQCHFGMGLFVPTQSS